MASMQTMAKAFQTPTKSSGSCGKWECMPLRENASPVQLKKKTPKAKTPGRAVMICSFLLNSGFPKLPGFKRLKMLYLCLFNSGFQQFLGLERFENGVAVISVEI